MPTTDLRTVAELVSTQNIPGLYTTNSSMMTSLPLDDDYPVPHPVERGFEAALLVCIFLVAFLGNLLLWIVVIRHRSLRTESNALVLCLSSADLLVSLASMTVTIVTVSTGRWVFSTSVCTALGFLTMCTLIASVMSLGAISINRYILIVHPSKFKIVYTRRNTGFFIAGVWILAILLALPPLTKGWGAYGYLPNQSFCFCRWRTSISYTFFMVTACFGCPCAVMTFCYVNILRVVRQSRKRVASRLTAKQQQEKKQHTKCNSKTLQAKNPALPAVITVNGGADQQSSSGSMNQHPSAPCYTTKRRNTHEMIRSQLKEILRSRTVAMSQNELPQSGQFDVTGDRVLPENASARAHNMDCTSMQNVEPTVQSSPRPQREIKWIVPDNLPGSVPTEEDGNSNKMNGRTHSLKGPTERSTLVKQLTIPGPIDISRRKNRKKNRSESEKRRKEEELKLTKSFLVVIFIFVACWFPFCITMFWSVFAKEDNAVPRPVDIGTLLLGYLNSCCNPIIYGVMNKRFRAGYKNILCRWKENRDISLNGSHLDPQNSGVLPGNSSACTSQVVA